MSGKKPVTLDCATLERVPLFRGLAAEALEDIAAAARSRHFAKGKAVFQQGAPATQFFVVAHGEIKVSQTTRDGQQVVMHYVGAGEFMGCAALTGRASYPGTATAVVDSVLLCWDAAATMRLVARHGQIAVNAIGTMGDRLGEVHARLRELSTERVEQRVARALIRLARQTGVESGAGIEIRFPLTRQDIAEMTGTTLHTVSRIMSAWAAQGLLAGDRHRITILAPHRLVLVAEDIPAAGRPREDATPRRRA
jgi:CRP-like cAMP-binding protein